MKIAFQVLALLFVASLVLIAYGSLGKPSPLAHKLSVLEHGKDTFAPIDDQQRLVLTRCMNEVSSAWLPDIVSYVPQLYFVSPSQNINVLPGLIVVNEKRSFGWIEISARSKCYDNLIHISPPPVHPEGSERG